MVGRFFLTLLSLGIVALRMYAQEAGLPQLPPGLPPCAQKSMMPGLAAHAAGIFADANIDVTSYALDFTLAPALQTLQGAVTMRAVILRDTLRVITLDLNGNMRVDSVRSGTRRIPFTQFPAGLSVSLERPYVLHELAAVTVFYKGSPAASGFGSFVFSGQNNVPWIWSLSEPYGARDWWPCKDNTLDKADSVDMRVTVPTGLIVGSNGRLVGAVNNGNGTTTFHWAERHPIAAYLVSVAVSNYAQFTDWFRYSPADSMPVLNYVLPQSLVAARAALSVTTDMLAVFSEKFGLYPFIDEKYGHAQFGWGGAMEHQTMTSTSNFAEYTISHELAHQWFGDMITCANWQNLWLNEGFATFCETLYGGIRHGDQEYRAHLGDMMTPALTAEGSLYLRDTSDVASMFVFNNVYAKGAWVLHMLRHVLGDSTFFAALRAYCADPRFRFGSATTDGFRDVCESVAGRSLGFFFDEWVYGEGYPKYTFDWTTAAGDSGYDVSVRVHQSATGSAPSFFIMPVELRFGNGVRDTTVVVQHTSSGQLFRFRLPFPPSSVRLDPDKNILREVLTPDQLPVAFGLEQNYPNPFNPGTSIPVTIPRRADVSLVVYDLLGREVAVVFRGRMDPGNATVRWDGRDTNGRPAATGVYFCRMTAGDFTATRRMILLR